MKWEDSTSYSQRKPDKTPNSWTAVVGPFRLFVTRAHIHYPGKWVMGIVPIMSATEIQLPFEAATETDAQAFAVAKFRSLLEQALNA